MAMKEIKANLVNLDDNFLLNLLAENQELKDAYGIQQQITKYLIDKNVKLIDCYVILSSMADAIKYYIENQEDNPNG